MASLTSDPGDPRLSRGSDDHPVSQAEEERVRSEILTVCPRCGSEVYWVELFDDREDLFAMCVMCPWGED